MFDFYSGHNFNYDSSPAEGEITFSDLVRSQKKEEKKKKSDEEEENKKKIHISS